MISTELIKKIRHIEIRTRRLVNDSYAGEYHSIFKGRGMEFDEVRPYQIGDEIRTIDWNVTARTRVPTALAFAALPFLSAASLSTTTPVSTVWACPPFRRCWFPPR